MPEGNVGKFTSPFSSDTDSIKCGHDDVTQPLPQLETFVRNNNSLLQKNVDNELSDI
jgi:hypothetical protein